MKNVKKIKKVGKRLKKVFQPAFGGMQHPEAGRNTQHSSCLKQLCVQGTLTSKFLCLLLPLKMSVSNSGSQALLRELKLIPEQINL